MVGPIETTVICNSKYEDRVRSGIDEHTTNLTVKETINIAAAQGETDLSETDCIVSIIVSGEPPTEAIFEYLRKNHPESPIVVASNKEENTDLIEEIITDDLSEYIFLTEETIPFGLLSVRCKQLVSRCETNNEYTRSHSR